MEGRIAAINSFADHRRRLGTPSSSARSPSLHLLLPPPPFNHPRALTTAVALGGPMRARICSLNVSSGRVSSFASSIQLHGHHPFRRHVRGISLPSLVLRSDKADAAEKQKQGLFKSLLHGSDSAKADGLTQSHSATVARGKYIHEIQRHEVRPEFVNEYRQMVSEYFPKIHKEPAFNARLKGSWEVFVGDLDTFYHIWEYDGYAGYDSLHSSLHNYKPSSSISSPSSGDVAVISEMNEKLKPYVRSRSNWLTQEFAFWASSGPKVTNGLYELRTYHLKPGMLLEWESHWRRGLEARRKFVQPIGAWFTQIGGLHTVFHIWEYPSLEARKATRDSAWQVETWNDTVSQTVKLIDRMHAQILQPLDFSPLK